MTRPGAEYLSTEEELEKQVSLCNFYGSVTQIAFTQLCNTLLQGKRSFISVHSKIKP